VLIFKAIWNKFLQPRFHPQCIESTTHYIYLSNRDKQSAVAQQRKITALDVAMANKLYAVIYGNLLVNVKKNSQKNKSN